MNLKLLSLVILLSSSLLGGCVHQNQKDETGNVDVPNSITYNHRQYNLTDVVYQTKGYPNGHLQSIHKFTDKGQEIYMNKENDRLLYVRTDNNLWVQYKD